MRIQIVDKDLNVQTRYEKQGFILAVVEVEDSRIHIQRLVKMGISGMHTQIRIPSSANEVAKTDIMDHIGWFASEVRRKVYFCADRPGDQQNDQDQCGKKADL